MNLIKRGYQKTLEKRLLEPNPRLQILLGPRQVGKTTAAISIFESWKDPKIMVSADSPSPPKPEWIRFHWEQARMKGKNTLLIIDEVQKVSAWSEQVKALYDEDQQAKRKGLKVVLLGSSSLYLQRGLSESLAGRFELIKAPHWSFAEFKEAFNWDFEKYFRFGAYPGAVEYVEDEQRWRDYILNSIIEPVLSKDILGIHPVNKPALFRQTFELAAHHPAYIISLQKILGQLQDRGNAETIKNYLYLLEQSFLIKTLQKFSGSVVQTKSSSPKIIILNQALTHAYQSQDRLSKDSQWYGHVFESLLGAKLSQIPNSQLYFWREGNFEVDYILRTPDKTVAIEIKSGWKQKSGAGLQQFAKRFPKIECDLWDKGRCLQFLIDSRI